MNDEPSSSTAAAAAASANDHRHRYHNTDGFDQPAPTPTAAETAERQKKNRENFNRRRVELLDDLLQSIDILVYAQLSAIYYMDCSFIRFLIRAFIQLLFITPKPALLPEPPGNRPYIGALFGSNILCIAMHIFLSAPSADSATRGYLHGGLALDFIGQKGPTSKIRLLLLDMLVVLLQTVQLSSHILRQRLRDSPAARIAVTTASGNQYAAAPPSTGQTVEDEERGVRRSAEAERQGDIEMQTLNPPGLDTTADGTPPSGAPGMADREALWTSTTLPQQSHSHAHIFNAFNSGQIVVADINLAATVHEQFWAYQKAPRDTNSAETNRLMRERLARRVLRWRFDSPVGGGTLG